MENLVNSKSFWKNKRVLITGHTGFKGSWLSIWLKYLGGDVVGYALPPKDGPNLYTDANVQAGITSIYADIRDLDKLSDVFTKYKPQIVIHMAAQSLVRPSFKYPVDTYTTNVIGTVNVLEAARLQKDKKISIINVTTDKCYENQEWVWGYRETDRLGGYDPYSNSKACSELVTASYRNSFFNSKYYDKHKIAIASARAGNVIGGGDWSEDRLIPDIIRSIITDSTLEIRSPDSIRPWQHVLEPLNGYLMLAEALWKYGPEYADAWNFGPNEEDAKSVSWIVDRITSLWNEVPKWNIDKGENPHEAGLLKLDCSKAKTQLGWKPILSISEALKLLVDWYKVYLINGDLENNIKQQIEYFYDHG